MAGVVVLVNPFSGGAPSLVASAVALGGALSWGCGSVYAKRAPHPDQPLLGSGLQLICAGAALCAAGAASGELARVHASSLASPSTLALGYRFSSGAWWRTAATTG
jgi:drug/metabolite transporter (DMT)-like permease